MNPEPLPCGRLAAVRRLWALLMVAWLAFSASVLSQAPESRTFSIKREPNAVVVRNTAGRVVLQYQLQRPADSQLAVESACYFHPIATPRGVFLTDVAPSDHLHHRGVFLAWVEMHGQKDADFWGWGEHAPKNGRRILNEKVSGLHLASGTASFTASNAWMAEEMCLVKEDVRVSVRETAPAYIIDLARWAFSGFCVRLRKDGRLEAEGPDGPVNLGTEPVGARTAPVKRPTP